jgi:hypothetical protein
MTTKSEFWANGYDDGYEGRPLDTPPVPGTSAFYDYLAGYEDGATDSWNEYDVAETEDDYDVYGDESEPEMSLQFEHDSAMTSIGWGTDEDYGYFGGDEDY